MTYAFVLDASACSGCKACQVACKDKNALPLGVLWRRVYEVSGGAWQQQGAAWSSTLFAYNLSMSCNHCVHPKCAGVCPVDAYTVREDGIVILDASKCIGCGYCAWACPYAAPQYDRSAGRMTKCDFCYDNLELGLAPACVSACPLRALDYAEVGAGPPLAADQIALWDAPAASHPYPMPAYSRTQPHLAIKPHAGMSSSEVKRTANREEVGDQAASGWDEAPLVAFTLFIQLAVGAFWAMGWLIQDAASRLLPMLLVGLCLGAGLVTSFAHLGTPQNAWRVLKHLRKSSLSREILFTILFGAGWLATLVSMLFRSGSYLLLWLTALLGVELLHYMSQVYRLRAVPAWNTWRTEVRFFLSAAVLGIVGTRALSSWLHLPALAWRQAGIVLMLLLFVQAVMAARWPLSLKRRGLQLGWIQACMLGTALVFFLPEWLPAYSGIPLLLLILGEQVMERWFFYQARTRR